MDVDVVVVSILKPGLYAGGHGRGGGAAVLCGRWRRSLFRGCWTNRIEGTLLQHVKNNPHPRMQAGTRTRQKKKIKFALSSRTQHLFPHTGTWGIPPIATAKRQPARFLFSSARPAVRQAPRVRARTKYKP